MIEYKKKRDTIVNLLKAHTGVEVVLANQAAHIPPYPYISFTITTPMTANNGTYGRYSDGFDRKPVKQIWSITSQAQTLDEAQETSQKAHDFFDRCYEVLAEDEIVVVRLGDITSRDNFLTTEYEYRCGFDVTFGLMNEIECSELDEGEIETANIILEQEE